MKLINGVINKSDENTIKKMQKLIEELSPEQAEEVLKKFKKINSQRKRKDGIN
jgi:isopropylmalate/homocitrate/citramalate synthase